MVRMPLRQWTLKITKYADQLEAGLKGLEWPEGTLTAQKQWIGRSEGTRYASHVGSEQWCSTEYVSLVLVVVSWKMKREWCGMFVA